MSDPLELSEEELFLLQQCRAYVKSREMTEFIQNFAEKIVRFQKGDREVQLEGFATTVGFELLLHLRKEYELTELTKALFSRVIGDE